MLILSSICKFYFERYLVGIFQACKLKLGDFNGALLDTDFAIREREGHSKAYFRQGKVLKFI
jgi:hypothetical protein